MKYLTILTVLLAVAYAQDKDDATKINPPNCGRRFREIQKGDENKIVGGQRADPEDWGWQIALNQSGRMICGGSLINSQWVVTASHCVDYNLNPLFYSVDIGVHDRSKLEPWATTRKIVSVKLHPNYDPRGLKNDIALLKLDRPVEYSDQVVPVCIPDGSEKYEGKLCYATGFGSLYSGGSVVRYLMEVQMSILTNERCLYKYPSSNSTVELCAGDNEGKDTCQGDSGGPLVVKNSKGNWDLVGITSWGYGCGNGGVYARTATFKDWIKNHIKNN